MYINRVDKYKEWINVPKSKITEGLRISDLRKNQGVSQKTLFFKKERDRILGNESRVLKFIDLDLNPKLDYIKVTFLTEVTPKYPEDYVYKETEPENYKVKGNKSKTYTEEVMFVDFFSWLNTHPEITKITIKDLKEVIQVCDIKVYCSCMSFNFQGIAYKLTSEFDSAIYPQTIPDPVWGERHNDENLLCKHLQGVINNFSFFQNNIASSLTKKLKNRNLI